ncbi:hypothetical protein CCACVL1_04626 [Corchorus capsularis]|uniref:Uncharacterized protein n=1 Tax=Corchorus capsularis TaxID=210143 RepID=A0A1R3JQU9_COCAP|nr:hypothetical protein CCACVL1_04626 [Corchorus capsularis]
MDPESVVIKASSEREGQNAQVLQLTANINIIFVSTLILT